MSPKDIVDFPHFVQTLRGTLQTLSFEDQSPDETIASAQKRSLLQSLDPKDDWGSLGEHTDFTGSTAEIESPEQGSSQDSIQIRDTLGEGGMGVVYLASQEQLKREVAVKSVRMVNRTSKAKELFIQEARLTGLLEHPNIIPVYSLGEHGDGFPLLVMKRIAGVSWKSVLKGDSELPSRLQVSSSPLICHIHILMQVIDAIHFAHTKGIIHRDLKPENVMLGAFGEVYVLDWGLGVSIQDDCPEHFPSAKEANEVSGTPSYMAPEQTYEDGSQLGTFTDIYLLGSILHELIIGYPPHHGDNIHQVLFHAYRSEPYPYDKSIPKSLATICQTSMAREPEDRYVSVIAFQEALKEYLQHRDAEELCVETLSRLEHFKEQLLLSKSDKASQENPALSETSDTEAQLYMLFGQCRFGFQQSLRLWSENPQAIDGLQETLESMIDYELHVGVYRASAILFKELPKPNPELEQRLQALAEKNKQEKAKLQRLASIEYEHDFDVNAKARSRIVLGLAVLWGLIPVIAGLLDGFGIIHFDPAISTEDTGYFHLVFAGVLCILFYRIKYHLDLNIINRRMVYSGLVFFFLLSIYYLSTRKLGISKTDAYILENFLFLLFSSTLIIHIDKRFIVPFLFHGLALALSIWLQTWLLFISGVSHLVALTYIGLVWESSSNSKAPKEKT